jgi:hypothetical protein
MSPFGVIPIGDMASPAYGTDVLSLSVICRCLEKLLENKRVERYLQQHHAGTSDELRHLMLIRLFQPRSDRPHAYLLRKLRSDQRFMETEDGWIIQAADIPHAANS